MTLRPATCRGFVGLLNPPETIVTVIPLPNDPDMLFVASQGAKTLPTLQLQTLQNQVVRKFQYSHLVAHEIAAQVNAAVITSDSRFVICGYSNGLLTRHDVATGKLLNERLAGLEEDWGADIFACGTISFALAVNASNTILAVGHNNGKLELATLDLTSFATVTIGGDLDDDDNRTEPVGPITHLLALGENTIAAKGGNPVTGVYIVRPDAATGALQAMELKHTQFESLYFCHDPMSCSPDGRLLACMATKGVLSIFNIETRKRVAKVCMNKPDLDRDEECEIESLTFCTQDLILVHTVKNDREITKLVNLVSVSLSTVVSSMTFQQLGVPDVRPAPETLGSHDPADAMILKSRVAASPAFGAHLCVVRSGSGGPANMMQLYPLDVSPANEGAK